MVAYGFGEREGEGAFLFPSPPSRVVACLVLLIDGFLDEADGAQCRTRVRYVPCYEAWGPYACAYTSEDEWGYQHAGEAGVLLL